MFRFLKFLIVIFIALISTGCCFNGLYGNHPVVTQPVPVSDLSRYSEYPANVKQVIGGALKLSKKHLSYKFGSANPRNHGMDCSGTIYYLLKNIRNTYVPRDSYDMYIWLLKAGKIHHVTTHHFHSSQFDALRPGDLLFWTGTYRTHRKPPITHVMLYLGKNKQGVPLMFGANNGGIYKRRRMYGVSVFNFIMPGRWERRRFVAYGCIPSFTCS